jgi:N-acetylglucosamine-6-sulfatase
LRIALPRQGRITSAAGSRRVPGGSATEYNYEKQFPYTPNVRGVRTDDWKYIHYPHGDEGPDRHKAELYHLTSDPKERKNRIDDPACAAKLAELKTELHRLIQETGALPDRMPIDEGVKKVLPEKSIR